jgi:hypothetical protein
VPELPAQPNPFLAINAMRAINTAPVVPEPPLTKSDLVAGYQDWNMAYRVPSFWCLNIACVGDLCLAIDLVDLIDADADVDCVFFCFYITPTPMILILCLNSIWTLSTLINLVCMILATPYSVPNNNSAIRERMCA